MNTSAIEIAVRLLQSIGEDVNREGLQGTPARYAKSLKEWFAGYDEKDFDLTSFGDGAEGYDGMVIETNIPVWFPLRTSYRPVLWRGAHRLYSKQTDHRPK